MKYEFKTRRVQHEGEGWCQKTLNKHGFIEYVRVSSRFVQVIIGVAN